MSLCRTGPRSRAFTRDTNLDARRADFQVDRLRRGRRPEIETDWYNFTALNNPENHRRARCRYVLRGRARRRGPTSGVADPYLANAGALCAPASRPDPVIAAGRTTGRQRCDPFSDVSPGRGLWLDEDISFADLKGVYTDFLRRFFESEDLQVRFRPPTSVHRTVGRDRHDVHHRPRKVTGSRSRSRTSPSDGRSQFRFRSGAYDGICLRLRAGTAHDASLRVDDLRQFFAATCVFSAIQRLTFWNRWSRTGENSRAVAAPVLRPAAGHATLASGSPWADWKSRRSNPSPAFFRRGRRARAAG